MSKTYQSLLKLLALPLVSLSDLNHSFHAVFKRYFTVISLISNCHILLLILSIFVPTGSNINKLEESEFIKQYVEKALLEPKSSQKLRKKKQELLDDLEKVLTPTEPQRKSVLSGSPAFSLKTRVKERQAESIQKHIDRHQKRTPMFNVSSDGVPLKVVLNVRSGSLMTTRNVKQSISIGLVWKLFDDFSTHKIMSVGPQQLNLNLVLGTKTWFSLLFKYLSVPIELNENLVHLGKIYYTKNSSMPISIHLGQTPSQSSVDPDSRHDLTSPMTPSDPTNPFASDEITPVTSSGNNSSPDQKRSNTLNEAQLNLSSRTLQDVKQATLESLHGRIVLNDWLFIKIER